MAVILSDLLDEKQIALDLNAETKEEALRQIVSLLAQNRKLTDPEKFLAAILTREQANSTLADHGVAFPHTRTSLAPELMLAIGRSQTGIPFGKAGEAAHLIFVIGVPQQMIQDYLVCVGAIARLVKQEKMRESLMTATTPAEFTDLLREAALVLE